MLSQNWVLVFITQRRVTAQDALLRLQDISAGSSDGEYSDSEPDDELINDIEIDFSDGEDRDSSSEDDEGDIQNPGQANQDLIGKDRSALQALAVPTSNEDACNSKTH